MINVSLTVVTKPEIIYPIEGTQKVTLGECLCVCGVCVCARACVRAAMHTHTTFTAN